MPPLATLVRVSGTDGERVPIERAQENLLLASIPGEVVRRLLEDASLVAFRPGDRFLWQGARLTFVFFPFGGVLSGVHYGDGGTSGGASTWGREGALNAAAAVRPHPRANLEVAADVGGEGLWVPMKTFRAALHDSNELLLAVLLRVQAQLEASQRSIEHIRYHPAGPRTATRLYHLAVEARGQDVTVSHMRLAELVGVRRQSISEVLRELREAGVIEQHRGSIQVKNMAGLRARACECCGAIDHLERALTRRLVAQLPVPDPPSRRGDSKHSR